MAHIAIIQGHPDPDGGHFCHALAQAYADGATAAGHNVRSIDIARLEFPLLRDQSEFETGTPPADIIDAQNALARADHILIVYPLWLVTMPALLKGFFEQTIRPGFAIKFTSGYRWEKLLKGRSARIVVTMSMPALAYRVLFDAHSLRSLERYTLRFCGIGPIRESLVGSVGEIDSRKREGWLERMRRLGQRAD
jgi:putative NADPH-quinone reductase